MKEGQAALLSSLVFQNEIPVANKVTYHIYIYIYDFPFSFIGYFFFLMLYSSFDWLLSKLYERVFNLLHTFLQDLYFHLNFNIILFNL